MGATVEQGENQCTLYIFGPLGWLEAGLRVSSVSDHPSNGWERPKQAGWEFRVKGLGFRVKGLGFRVKG